MTQHAVNNVESRFQDLKNKVSAKQWNDVDDLCALAKEIEATDLALARRVLQRAKNLRPNDKVIAAELRRLSKAISAQNKEQMVSSSKEHTKLNSVKQFWQTKIPESARQKIVSPISLFVFLPFLLFAFYQVIWASPGYESRARVIVQQPDGMATMDASMALLSGLGVSAPTSNDLELVKNYINSQDMVNYVLSELDFVGHYSNSDVDMFSRLSSDASKEDIFDYYSKHVEVIVDDKSAIISILSTAYTRDFAYKLNRVLVERAEWYINSIGHQLANSQLDFIKKEHQVVESKMEAAKADLLNFQQKYNLLDPIAEGAAVQQIAYGLEGQIATLEAELKNLLAVMTPEAPQVEAMQAKIFAMRTQLEIERQRLSVQQSPAKKLPTDKVEELSSVSEILARYTEYKVALELAIQGYTASQISLEKSRIEAYRQLKYLVIVEAPTQPEDNQYPEVTYNLTLFLVVALMLFGITKIILATVKELN